jgi:hypothetical protein
MPADAGTVEARAVVFGIGGGEIARLYAPGAPNQALVIRFTTMPDERAIHLAALSDAGAIGPETSLAVQPPAPTSATLGPHPIVSDAGFGRGAILGGFLGLGAATCLVLVRIRARQEVPSA